MTKRAVGWLSRIGWRVCFITTLVAMALIAQAAADTLDHVRQSGKLTLGYRNDARPFSYRNDNGAAAGYAVALCQKIADQVKADLGLSTLTTDWVQVPLEGRFRALAEHKVDLLCGADTETLARRKDVSFSIPIFPSGIGAMLRADAPAALRDTLAQGRPQPRAIWRASPARIVLEKQTFAVIPGTTSERWLSERISTLEISAAVLPVESYQAGVTRLIARGASVFFGDRPLLLDLAKRSGADLIVLDRLFTEEPIALALARDDDSFRLAVDATLSRLYRSEAFPPLYATWFGAMDASATNFFRLTALPE